MKIISQESSRQNNNLGGMRLGFDEKGNPGYYDPDGNFKTFINTTVSPVDLLTVDKNKSYELVVEEDSINYTIATCYDTTVTLNDVQLTLSPYGYTVYNAGLFVCKNISCKKGDIIKITNVSTVSVLGVAVAKTSPIVDVFTVSYGAPKTIVIEHDSNNLMVAYNFNDSITLNGSPIIGSPYGYTADNCGVYAIKGISCKKGDVLVATRSLSNDYHLGCMVAY